MRIGELARAAHVSTKTIRYYEDIGLLPEPARAPNGYRDYDAEAMSRLRFIRDAQATGLSLTEVASILDLRSQGVRTCDHVAALLERHLNELDRHIESLRRTRDQLNLMTQRAKALDPADCTDPNRCQTIQPGSGVDSAVLHAQPRPHRHGD